MSNMVTHKFTMDDENVYIVNNGNVTREPIKGSLGHYADSGSNVGYLDKKNKGALRIRNNDIARIDYDAFMELRKNGTVEPTEMRGVISITYDASVFTDHILGTSTRYKLSDKDGVGSSSSSMYDGSQLVDNGRRPSGLQVASAAMNMSQEERERIGLVNQGVPETKPVDVGTNKRFGSSIGESGKISTGSIHRPRSLSSTLTFPFEAPCVVRKTAPYYTMLAMKKPFIEFTKPVESFLTANITIDKRIPMRVVPMVTSDKHGYAFPKKVNSDEKVVSDRCIPVATRVPGIYWMFYEMARSEEISTHEIQFICSALIEYIDSKSMSFDLSKSGVAASVVNSLGTVIDEIGYDTSDKEKVIDIYRKFFEETGKGLFRPMKISYKSGFVIAMTRSATQVLLASVIINSNIDYSKYPEHITVIPLEENYGLLVVGAEPTDISMVERVMSGAEEIQDDDDFDQPDD